MLKPIRYRVVEVELLEILDSRGRPTFECSLRLDNGAKGLAGVPSGASTGRGEAYERREGARRYGGGGVAHVWASVADEVRAKLADTPWSSLAELDDALCVLDGTENKSRLGGNVTIGISMAGARALAQSRGEQLWESLTREGVAPRLPVPHFNVINGGAHAQTELTFQEFMVAPIGARDLPDAIRAGAEIYQMLRSALHDAGYPTGLGDEGGFAPPLSTPEEALNLLVEAVTAAGYPLGPSGVMFALDPAANGFRDASGSYRVGDERLSSDALIDRYESLLERFPIWSIEDGVAEDDDDGWMVLTTRLGERLQLVGDDNLVTSATRIDRAADRRIANAALIKPNQIGTVTETIAAVDAARAHGYGQMVSHRSGETSDTFIADLAVAVGCGQVKFGAPARGERVAKYNRLLRLAAARPDLPYGLPKGMLDMIARRADA